MRPACVIRYRVMAFDTHAAVKTGAMVCALAALATSGFAQVLRHPPNAQAGQCLDEPGRPWLEAFTTTTVEPDGTGAVRASFTLTNQCATRISVSGLEPTTALGASIIADAAIEVVLVTTDSDAETVYLSDEIMPSPIGSRGHPVGLFIDPPLQQLLSILTVTHSRRMLRLEIPEQFPCQFTGTDFFWCFYGRNTSLLQECFQDRNGPSRNTHPDQ